MGHRDAMLFKNWPTGRLPSGAISQNTKNVLFKIKQAPQRPGTFLLTGLSDMYCHRMYQQA